MSGWFLLVNVWLLVGLGLYRTLEQEIGMDADLRDHPRLTLAICLLAGVPILIRIALGGSE